MTPPPRGLLELSREDVEALVAAAGQPRYRADQILGWVHARGVVDPEAMTDLPRTLREALCERWPAAASATPATVQTGADGTMKLVLALADRRTTETVLIPEAADEPDDDEPPSPVPSSPVPLSGSPIPNPQSPIPAYTQCLSTQIGCAFGCVFCRSGSHGFVRNLSAGEILAQRREALRAIAGRGAIVRTVVMGVGEPLHNLDELLRALRLMTDRRAGNVSPRRITVSTIGLPAGIRALGEAFGGRLALAWSLHAADEETRRRLLPGAARRPVAEVVRALREYPLPARSRFTVECVLVRGINDSVRHARDVVRLLSGLRCKVNLIPFNPWVDPEPADRGTPLTTHDSRPTTALQPPDPATLAAYQETVAAAGLSVFLRRPRGADILAACGQRLGRPDLSSGSRWDS